MSDSLPPHELQHARQASLSITNSRRPPKPMSIESVMPSNHLILCCALLFWPSIFPSIRVFSNESALHIRWRKYWSFSLNISPSNEHPGLISFRMDWLDLLAVQGTLKSLLQHHRTNLLQKQKQKKHKARTHNSASYQRINDSIMEKITHQIGPNRISLVPGQWINING